MNTQKELLIQDIKKSINDLSILKNYLKCKKHELALLNCPFIIGDRLINEHGVIAVMRDAEYYYSDNSYLMKISKINKNGDISKAIINSYDHDGWVKSEV